MKTLLLPFLFLLWAPLTHALEFEVQPLSVQSQSDVIGVQVGQTAQKAIIFKGPAAQRIAQAIGQNVNISQEMIVMTGPECDSLVHSALAFATFTGKSIFITSAWFAKESLKLALGAISLGVRIAWLPITTAYTIGKTVVYSALMALKLPFYVLGHVGRHLFRGTHRMVHYDLRYVCAVPYYFGRHHLRCH